MVYDQYYFKIKVVLEGLILQSNRNPLMPKMIMKITIYMTCKLLSKSKLKHMFVLSPHRIHAIKCESERS